MQRYRLLVEYDGTGLAGWQRQDGQPSVQQFIEEALQRYCGAACVVQCAGRTDAGVHAAGQVAHADLPVARDAYSVQQGINFHLATPQIAIRGVEPVAESFHARFDAVSRQYRYRIINRSAPLALDRHSAWQIPEPLDVAVMQRAADACLGLHDFSSFRDSQCQAKSPIKTLDGFGLIRHGEVIEATLEARSFLHHQVRILMGTMRLIGNGKWSLETLAAAFAAKDRRAGGPTAPPQGLTLMHVGY